MQTKCRVIADSRPSQPTWTLSLPEMAATVHIHHRHLLLLSPKADTHFTIPRRVGRPSRPRHCSKGVQSMPKAVYSSGCRDKHNSLWTMVRFKPGSSHTTVRHQTDVAAWPTGNIVGRIYEVTPRRARLVLGWVTCPGSTPGGGTLFPYVTSHPG